MLEFIRRPWAIPTALFVSALALRLLGIGWGLKNDLHNQSYHPDELPIWAMSQNVEPAKGKFTPGVYNYGTLYLTVLRVASDMVGVYGGGPDAKNKDRQWAYISRCHLAGRVVSAVAGALTVLLLFLMLRRRVNEVGAVMGAMLVAVAPAHVVHSRFQTVDVVATFLLTVSLYFSLRLLPKCVDEGSTHGGTGDLADNSVPGAAVGRRSSDHPHLASPIKAKGSRPKVELLSNPLNLALLAGVFAGLSAGTKYTGVLAILVLVAVLALRCEEGWAKRLGAGCAACVAAFFISTPGVVLDSAAFWRDFTFEMHHTATEHGLVFVGTPIGFIAHIVNLIQGVGPLLVLLGFAGLVFGAVKKCPWIWALLAFAVPFYLLIGRAEVTFLRYTFPLYIPLAAGFAHLMGYAHERREKFVFVVMLGIMGLGGVDPGGLRVAGNMTAWMMSEDPRDTVALTLKEVAKGGTVGLVTDPWFYTPPLYPDTALGPAGAAYILGNMPDAYSELIRAAQWRTVPEALFGIRDRLMRQATDPQVERYVPGDFGARIDWDARLLTEKSPDYVVFSNYEVADQMRLVGRIGLDPGVQDQVRHAQEFMKELKKSYEVVQWVGGPGIGVHDMDYIRPTIWVWKRKTN